MRKYTTDEFQDMIDKYWDVHALSLYFAQVLSGEETIDSSIKDLLSLKEKL